MCVRVVIIPHLGGGRGELHQRVEQKPSLEQADAVTATEVPLLPFYTEAKKEVRGSMCFEFGTTMALIVRVRWNISKVSPCTQFPGDPTNNFQALKIENGIPSNV